MIDSLALSYYTIKKSTLIEALNDFGSAEAILNASFYELCRNNRFTERSAQKIISHRDEYRRRAEKELPEMADYGITVLAYGSKNYPSLLAECVDAPLVLYVLGCSDMEVKREKWISVIGTKRATDVGYIVAEKLITDIAAKSRDTVIVSSLTEGIEMKVHTVAVRAGLRCVAVLPCSIDQIQSEHFRELATEILSSGGSIVSEYPLGQRFMPFFFNERNRIVAGLSHATIVVEAPLESNTLKSADIAASYSREVFAFPGRVTDNSYKGNNFLIVSQRAQMMLSFEDVALSLEMNIEKSEVQQFMPQLTPDEKLIYDCLLDGDAHSEDEILERSGLDVARFYATVLAMELDELVVVLIGKMYIIKPR